MWTKNYASPLLMLIAVYEGIRKSREYDENSACYLDSNLLMILLFCFESSLLLEGLLKQFTNEKTVSRFELVSKLLLLFSAICYPINLLKSPGCMSSIFKFCMSCFFIPLVCIVLALCISKVASRILLIIEKMHTISVHQEIKTELVNSLKMSFSDPDQLTTFYSNYQQVLETMPVCQEELIYFKDNFEFFFIKPTKEAKPPNDKSECVICFDDISEGSNTIAFPKCGHLYHYRCLEKWLKKKPLCAFCKNDFRKGFAEEIKEKSVRKKLKMDPTSLLIAHKNTRTDNLKVKISEDVMNSNNEKIDSRKLTYHQPIEIDLSSQKDQS